MSIHCSKGRKGRIQELELSGGVLWAQLSCVLAKPRISRFLAVALSASIAIVVVGINARSDHLPTARATADSIVVKAGQPGIHAGQELLPFAEATVRTAVVNWREARDDRETFCRALDGS